MKRLGAFFEHHPQMPLPRRAAAEAIGTFLLVFTVVTAARYAQHFSEGSAAIAKALAIGPALTALILAFGPISGGHFNPLITLAQWLRRQRPTSCLLAYLAAQFFGAATAAATANLLIGNSVMAAGPDLSPSAVCVFEFIASFGLLFLVLSAPRMAPEGVGSFAVGGWVAMMLSGIPTAPAANPAITIGGLFAGAAMPAEVIGGFIHVGVQLGGLGLALATIYVLSPPTETVSGQHSG